MIKITFPENDCWNEFRYWSQFSFGSRSWSSSRSGSIFNNRHSYYSYCWSETKNRAILF